tara:strand:- start:671 stop:904 length:234 start_codon:yes stop_codon:yes gene_type:complete
MKAVSITDRIKYLHCDGGDEGTHGVLVLLGSHGYPLKAADIEDQAGFKFWYNNFVIAEELQGELAEAPRTGYSFAIA